MNEQPDLRVETTTVPAGVNYEGAIMSALTGQDMTGAPSPQPDPELTAWKMSGGREPGPAQAGGGLGGLLPDHEPEAGQ